MQLFQNFLEMFCLIIAGNTFVTSSRPSKTDEQKFPENMSMFCCDNTGELTNQNILENTLISEIYCQIHRNLSKYSIEFSKICIRKRPWNKCLHRYLSNSLMMLINCFTDKFTDKKRKTLFPWAAVRYSHHCKSPTRHEQELNIQSVLLSAVQSDSIVNSDSLQKRLLKSAFLQTLKLHFVSFLQYINFMDLKLLFKTLDI